MFWQSDKTPFIISIFAAVAGWAAVHTVDRVVTSPAIEYSISDKAVAGDPGVRSISVTLTNLSKEKTFRKTQFILRKPEKDNTIRFLYRASEGEFTLIRSEAPAMEAVVGFSDNVRADPNGVIFELPVFLPQSRYELTSRYRSSGNARPLFMGTPDPEKGDSFALLERSWFTFIAKYELPLLWSIVLIWLVGISAYYSTSFRKPGGAKHIASEGSLHNQNN